MRKLFCLFLLLGVSYTGLAQDLSAVLTVSQAYEYARDHMWSEVQVLPKSEAKYLMNPDRSKDPVDPSVGDESVVRNSVYKIVGDTVIKQINCAVIDFDTRQMSIEQIDSVRNRMVLEYRRHGSFRQLAQDHLPKDELYRYQEFRDFTMRIREMLDDDFVTRKKGDLFFHELTRSDDFKFLVLILDDPKDIDAFIVLKARLED